MKKLYLILFNVVSCAGWSYMLFLSVSSLLGGLSPYEFWTKGGLALNIVQSLACMEVLHSMFGIVRSPLLTTFLQVLSRVSLLWIYTDNFVELQSHWSLYLFTISWSLAEIPRYSFYALNIMKIVPYPLLFVRYSGFLVLYPTGITGEIVHHIAGLMILYADGRMTVFYILLVLLLTYVPGSPFMYFHMVGQRKKVLYGKKKKKKKREEGKKKD